MAALEEMMSNLKVDTSTVDGSASEETSCISSARDSAVDVKKGDKDDEHFSSTHQSSVLPTSANTSYYGYVYPGFDPTSGLLEEQSYYVAGDTTELHYPVMQADNGSLIYLTSGTQPSYDPYSHYVPLTVVGVDGYVSQPHPLSPMFQPSIGSPGYLQTPVMVQSPYLYDMPTFGVDGGYGNGYGSILENPVSKPGLSSHNHKHAPPSKTSFNDSLELKKSSFPTLDAPSARSMHNQLKAVGKSDLQIEGHYPCVKFPSYGQGKGGMFCANNHDKTNTKAWGINANTKVKSRVTNVGNLNLLNEQKYGIRTTNGKGSFIFGGNAVGSLATDGKGNSNSLASVTRRDQYNLPDFPTKYDHAFFFVIKSYSEDDVHKSIKYNVWASTPNGNKRLDNAYQVAQEKSKEKGTNCPVFLFFSVNASGQFCGVAEMIGRVDFDKNMDFWQQDKWNGYFPVKWHIIKDVPNPQLRHIILENNENKPVTNSRDTQEVRFPQGTEMLNILKNHISKTSILDDFEFYESRQRVMLEKRHRPLMPHLEHKQKTEELIKEEGKAGERARE